MDGAVLLSVQVSPIHVFLFARVDDVVARCSYGHANSCNLSDKESFHQMLPMSELTANAPNVCISHLDEDAHYMHRSSVNIYSFQVTRGMGLAH